MCKIDYARLFTQDELCPSCCLSPTSVPHSTFCSRKAKQEELLQREKKEEDLHRELSIAHEQAWRVSKSESALYAVLAWDTAPRAFSVHGMLNLGPCVQMISPGVA